jgi:squalene-hopene/tetraprenyl-beta-curcumene cyclase
MIPSLASVLLGLLAPDETTVRAAVERSLAFLEKEGVAWIEKRSCLSCHHVPFLLWSHREAAAKGIAVDATKLAGWTDWARKESLKQREKVTLSAEGLEALQGEGVPPVLLAKLAAFPERFGGSKEEVYLKELEKFLAPEEIARHGDLLLKHATRQKGDGGGIDTMAQLLLAGTYGSADADFIASTRSRILELQEANGSWMPGGQLRTMKRTGPEASQLTAMWTALALLESGGSAEPVSRARSFLKTSPPGNALEGLAVRLLLEKRLGEESAVLATLRDLLSRQNPDGGWASHPGGASDAFATGQVLYALRKTRASELGDSIERARAFLLGSQGADGSWNVPPGALSGRTMNAERLKNLDPIYRYWGTAWASIGLSGTLAAKP